MTKTEAFKTLRIADLKPGELITIPAEAIEWLGLEFFRARVSNLNSNVGMNLKTHKCENGNVQVWHSPDAKKSNVSPPLLNLIELRRMHEELQSRAIDKNGIVNAGMGHLIKEMCDISDEINAIINSLKFDPSEPRKKRGGAIHQPLEVILKHLRLKEKEWEFIPGRDKTRLRVKAELEIKAAQTAANLPRPSHAQHQAHL